MLTIATSPCPNTTLVTNFMQTIWNETQANLLDQFVDPGFVDHAYLPADKTGHANMVRVFAAAFSHATHEIVQSTEQDEMVVLRLRIRAVHTGQFRDIPATGNAIDVTQYRTFRVAQGKIAEHWALFDTATLLRQLQPAVIAAGACAIRQK